MKISNEYVRIEIGNKTYTRKNMILNTWIKKLFKNQAIPNQVENAEITECCLKLDTPLENLNYDSELTSSGDFDIQMFGGTRDSYVGENKFERMSTRTDNSVIVRYKFSNDGLFSYNGSYYSKNDFQMFIGRKITAIGFSYGETVFAVADVSNMNIIINSNENIIITRVDKYQSDGVCDGYEYPLHLVNYIANKDMTEESTYNSELDGYEIVTSQTIAKLYSIGLGNVRGSMESEDIINFYSGDIHNDYIDLYLSKLIKIGHYPSENLNFTFYPTMDNSKYLILKYRLYRVNNNDELTALDEYYTMSYPYDLSKYEGQTKAIWFKLKLERT